MPKLTHLEFLWRVLPQLGVLQCDAYPSVFCDALWHWCHNLQVGLEELRWRQTALCKTMCCVPTGSWIPTVSQPGTEHLLVPMAPTLLCIMFRFSGSALVAQAGDLVSNFWVLLHTSTTSNIVQLAISNQILNLLQHSKSKDDHYQGKYT